MSKEGNNTGRWTDEEHSRYEKGVELYGKDFVKLEQYVKTRSVDQIRTHHRGHERKLEKSKTPAKKRKPDPKEKGDGKKAKSASATPSKAASTPQKSKAAVKALSSSKSNSARKTVVPKSGGKTQVKIADLKPPAMPRSKGRAAASKKGSSQKQVKTSAKTTSNKGKVEEGGNSQLAADVKFGGRVLKLLQREDVLSVLVGMLGFGIIAYLKKMFP